MISAKAEKHSQLGISQKEIQSLKMKFEALPKALMY